MLAMYLDTEIKAHKISLHFLFIRTFHEITCIISSQNKVNAYEPIRKKQL